MNIPLPYEISRASLASPGAAEASGLAVAARKEGSKCSQVVPYVGLVSVGCVAYF